FFYTQTQKERFFLKKFLLLQNGVLYLHSQKQQAALVKGLRRIPFTDESRVRFPYAVQKGTFSLSPKVPFFLFPASIQSCYLERFDKMLNRACNKCSVALHSLEYRDLND